MSRQKARRKHVACTVVPALMRSDMERDMARDLAEMLRAWGSRRRASRQRAARPTEADIERSMRAAEEAAKRVAARRRPSGRV